MELTQDTPTDAGEKVHVIQGDTADWAEGFVNACINMHCDETLPPAAGILFNSGGRLLEEKPGSTQVRIGVALMLEALASSPDTLVHVARKLRHSLIEADPALRAWFGIRRE